MKKIVTHLSLIIAFITGMNSCTDFLDQPTLGMENLDTYFQTEEECLKQITGCYQSLLWQGWWQTGKFIIVTDMCTDDMWIGNTTQDPSDYLDLVQYTGNTQIDCQQSFWEYRYKGILRSNICIERIAGSPMNNEELRERMIAEAKFLRAFHYFDLVKNFGGVPIMLEMAMPSEVIGVQRATVEETYAQIEKDLQEAAQYLPLKSGYSSSDLGRATRGAALGYLAKAYLYQEKYEQAASVLKEIIHSNEYDLLPEFGSVWSIKTNNSIESLFEVQHNDDTSYPIGGRMSVICGSRDDFGWSWGLPTSHLENAFLEAGDSERLKWTIIKHGATEVPGDPTWSESKPYVISPQKHKSARVTRKLYIPVDQRPVPYNANHHPLNYRFLRYADILLMYAEVQNELANDQEARNALNKIRRRVHLPEVTASEKELRNAIRLERRLELALEGNRLFDLRRWTDDNGKKAICNIMGKEGSFVRYNLYESTDPYELGNIKERSDKGINFRENRDLLFPIPHTEVSISEGSIVQNPNY